MIRPGIWNSRINVWRLTTTVARTARATRPTSPPTSCTLVTSDAVACSTIRACGGFCPCVACRTSGRPGTICGTCWIAPNAAPYDIANISVVTIVVRRSSGANSAAMLGRLSVPDAFFCCQIGDSGRNGRMTISGIAGITPDMTVYRHGACGSAIPCMPNAASDGRLAA